MLLNKIGTPLGTTNQRILPCQWMILIKNLF